MNTGTLPLTGERTVPGVPVENYWFRRHEAAYLWATPKLAGRAVAEIGCGEGYGSALLADAARRVVSLDYDAVTVGHAAHTYTRPALDFVRANVAALPFLDSSVDAVATLQVIEHVWDHAQFVRECHRVLRPGGVLLVTTPNRLTFSPGRDEPTNPFHTHEFTARELTALLSSVSFEIDALFGVHAGAHIAELDRRYGAFATAQLAVEPEHWSAPLRRDVNSIRASDFRVVAAGERDIDEALDLVVLARRP